MKVTLLSLAAAFAVVFTSAATDVSVKLSDVHICCQSCVNGAKKVIGTVSGAKGDVNQDDETITITAADKMTVQKTVDALTAAGFFGKSSDASIKVDASTGAKNVKVKSVTVSDLHLCCQKCVNAVDKVVRSVPGATAQTAVKNAKTFEVTGDFNDKDLMDAFQKAGLTGKITKE